jgi:hypothetical protein
MALFSAQDYSANADYAGLGEINGIRDALEHPQSTNTFRGDETGWSDVPLAWLMSNRSLEAWARFNRWFDRLVKDWEAHRSKSVGPVTFTIQRGMESLLQVKKPPKAK